jgi:hypothetical protein
MRDAILIGVFACAAVVVLLVSLKGRGPRTKG